jgi:hypothetical protein
MAYDDVSISKRNTVLTEHLVGEHESFYLN